MNDLEAIKGFLSKINERSPELLKESIENDLGYVVEVGGPCITEPIDDRDLIRRHLEALDGVAPALLRRAIEEELGYRLSGGRIDALTLGFV